MKLRKPQPFQEASFDLTPMIDVVLLLIIFFMLSAQFAETMTRPMALPKEKGDPAAVKAASSVVVDIDATGGMTVLSGERVTAEQIVGMVKSAEAKRKATPGDTSAMTDLIVRAHRDCPSLHVNRLAGALAKGGVRSWKLATAGEF